ncbi:hypothetical protein SAMN04488003_10673 [Loktanella fryxellensis]|uniref:Uncharacterized protein n=1 Tax=Loktanella fryxellensis TaxID=245187 RepID=A0A1H8C5W2_9RHOB|nr:hypothetical protein [Loktanella fryxellensis]SEM90473.1 hypothetical protein SAMN04488003_10673 [Loktanella fryxellensis]
MTSIPLVFDRHHILRSDDVPSDSVNPGAQVLAMLHPPALQQLLFPALSQWAVAAIGATARPVARRCTLPRDLRDLRAPVGQTARKGAIRRARPVGAKGGVRQSPFQSDSRPAQPTLRTA